MSFTPAPAGPYRVDGNRILDSRGRPYLVRGTSLPLLTMKDSENRGGFGPFTPSAFVTLRQRMNMNAVRLPLDASEYLRNAGYRARARDVTRQAREFELLVILAADGGDAFWTRCAADFRDNPDVFFAIGSAATGVQAIRSVGAHQLIVAAPGAHGPGLIYEVPAGYADRGWELRILELGERAPVLANGLDPELEKPSAECAAFPSDPGEATALLKQHLETFDRHSISWTLSTLRPGGMVDNYRYLTWTKLDDGWTCGGPARDGIAMVLLAHLWNADEHGIFAVNQTAGGFVVSPGSTVTAYGPIMSDEEAGGHGPPWPTRLSNISVRVTDSRRVPRLAQLLHTGAGWAQVSFAIPEGTAPGPAEVAIVRTDGTSSAGQVLVRDLAPGFWTAAHDGRGPVIGWIIGDKQVPLWECANAGCRTVPIEKPGTLVRIEGTGFRHARSLASFRLTIDDVVVHVLSFGPTSTIGRDQLTFRMPAELLGRGEVDLTMTVDGALASVARINCGAPPAKVQLGRYLFYDKRLSLNGTTSCATCHRQELAFTDGRARALGATGQEHPRSAMSLVDLAYNRAFNWSDPTVHSLEDQALKPMLSTDPVELGFNVVQEKFLSLTRTDPAYRDLFPRAFPDERECHTIDHIAKAIAAFERTIVSSASPYDRYRVDRASHAISESAKRGEILYFLDGGPSCFRCHGGIHFSDGDFHNTGLYNPYLSPNRGLYEHTQRPEDMGKFRAPTLRNIALTAPYMHDGSIATLEEVIDHYAAGGRQGRDLPGKDKLVHGFALTPQNRADLVAFLESLTDDSLLRDPRFADPW